ncbi:MAG: EF-hand domain-containing protein [Zoogloea sp.]|nr:EF-hand domain-containing protein [Zoogloea sp.]
MVSSIGSYSSASAMTHSRPDPAQMASKLFSKLDTKGQGFIEESDLQSAFNQAFSSATSGTSASTSTDSSASALFKALDGDSDGQLTESEFSSSFQKLADALDSQAFSSRMGGAHEAAGMPPPPPPEDDAGFTQDQLSSQLSQIGSTDSERSDLISRIVSNFDKADANGDGKVSMQEAMTYDQSSQSRSTSSSTTDTSTASTTSSSQSDAALMHKLMELARAYGPGSDAFNSTSSLTVTA